MILTFPIKHADKYFKPPNHAQGILHRGQGLHKLSFYWILSRGEADRNYPLGPYPYNALNKPIAEATLILVISASNAGRPATAALEYSHH